jgi:DNA (cytosine-5)-methyltransferase 1
MEHREIKTPEQIAELKELSPGGYRNLREVVINELPTNALLPTPAVGHIRNHDEPIEDYLGRRQDYLDGKTKGMPGASLGVAVRMEMLPTPIVRDYKDGQAPSIRDGKVSVDTVGRAIMNSGEVNLLPTLRASDGYERRNQKTMDKIAAEGGDLTMPTLARTTVSWGKFTPAIERWEAVTRPAPAPTKPDGKDGNHRLSAEFTEWMMGLPAGWVTDPEMGLKRNDQLKACGNGVVPQQAELALRILLEDVNLEGK